MSDSNRSYFRPIVNVIFGVTVAVLSGAFIWDMASLNAQYSHYADTAAKEYASSTQQRIVSTCIDREFSAFSECVSEIINSTKESQRAEYDLKAQQSMAVSALWMLLLSAVALLLTGVGVWFVWRTLEATRDAVKAADDAVLETRRIGEAQVRAYFASDGVLEDPPVADGMWPRLDDRYKAVPTFINCGQSPMISLELKTVQSVVLHGHEFIPEPPEFGGVSVGNLGVGVMMGAPSRVGSHSDWASPIINDDGFPVLTTYYKYSDVFGRTYIGHVCWRMWLQKKAETFSGTRWLYTAYSADERECRKK